MLKEISDFFLKNKNKIIYLYLIMCSILSAAAITFNFEKLADVDAESGGLLW